MPKKILVADDDPAILEVIALILEFEGYEVNTTADGDNLRQIKKELPDVILLDIWMSGVDGRDVCADLKKNPATKDIPIIMISANKDASQIAQQCGADDFIAKPFEMDELLSKVQRHSIS